MGTNSTSTPHPSPSRRGQISATHLQRDFFGIPQSSALQLPSSPCTLFHQCGTEDTPLVSQTAHTLEHLYLDQNNGPGPLFDP